MSEKSPYKEFGVKSHYNTGSKEGVKFKPPVLGTSQFNRKGTGHMFSVPKGMKEARIQFRRTWTEECQFCGKARFAVEGKKCQGAKR